MTRPTPSDDLDAHLREHYARQSLSPERLERLVALAGSSPAPRRRWRGALAVAAALLLTVGATTIGLERRRVSELSRSTAEEVALNHRKCLPPEIAALAFADLGPQMPKLDFTPVGTARLAPGYHILGARYSTLQAQVALQVRLLDGHGRPLTLYQVPSAARLSEVRPGVYDCDGVTVTIWREQGLLFGLAAPDAFEF